MGEHRRRGIPRVKRAFDLAISSLGLVISAPIWALIAIAVKLEDGEPVFSVQERVEEAGRRFHGLKFRSMIVSADERFGPLQASDGDPRVTHVERILRATVMDELPQLWNIYKGDMSFVGPRALVPDEIEGNGGGALIPLEDFTGYEQRHSVKPGLTGLAQVYAPRDICRREKFRYGLLYIKRLAVL
jgi:lipopolysaccharide/colanic/teichoic acid biosynthesis glycosyltransferase